jgi:hypothetical protein
LNPDLPECQPDPCVLNPDLPECQPVPCILDPSDPTCVPCPPNDPKCGVPCQDGRMPVNGECPPPPIKCGKGTHLENGICVRDKDNGGSSRSSSSSSSSATVNANAAEVSSCKLDGSADGIQQKFDIAKYRACGLYLNGQIAYSNGFLGGCTQVGNTQQICQALVDSSIINTRTQATQLPTQTTTQPLQTPQTQTQSATPPTQTQPTQAIQPTQ